MRVGRSSVRLVAGEANVDRQADGVTALMLAARMGEVGIVRLLLQLGAIVQGTARMMI